MKKTVVAILVLLIVSSAAFASGGAEGGQAGGARELTIWEDLWANTAVSVSTLDETPMYIEAQRRLGRCNRCGHIGYHLSFLQK